MAALKTNGALLAVLTLVASFSLFCLRRLYQASRSDQKGIFAGDSPASGIASQRRWWLGATLLLAAFIFAREAVHVFQEPFEINELTEISRIQSQNYWLHGPLSIFLDVHHLSTGLATLSAKAFGATRLGYRLPSLLWCLAFLGIFLWFGRRWLSPQALFVLLVAIESAPLLDGYFHSMRTYSLGAAVSLFTLFTLLAWYEKAPAPNRVWWFPALIFVGTLVSPFTGLFAMGLLWTLLVHVSVTSKQRDAKELFRIVRFVLIGAVLILPLGVILKLQSARNSVHLVGAVKASGFTPFLHQISRAVGFSEPWLGWCLILGTLALVLWCGRRRFGTIEGYLGLLIPFLFLEYATLCLLTGNFPEDRHLIEWIFPLLFAGALAADRLGVLRAHALVTFIALWILLPSTVGMRHRDYVLQLPGFEETMKELNSRYPEIRDSCLKTVFTKEPRMQYQALFTDWLYYVDGTGKTRSEKPCPKGYVISYGGAVPQWRTEGTGFRKIFERPAIGLELFEVTQP